ncbi:MAG: lysophospholipase [Bdellovibrionales bacterium]
MIRRSEGYFKGHDGIELFFQAWTPDKTRGTLVVTHGLGEHSESYIRLAEALAQVGWEIFAWDMRGHGRSEGKRGTIKKFDDFSKDLRQFISHVQKLRPKIPMVLLGHSLGGLTTLRTLIENEDMGLKAVVLSSPLLGIAVEVPKIKKIAAQYLQKYLPDLTMYNEISNFDLTSDKAVIAEYERDSLRHDRISSNLFLEMNAAMERTKNQGSKIWLPVLIQQAGADRVVSRIGTEQFFQTIGSANKKLIVYEDFMHEVYNEVRRQEALRDLATWLEPFLD